MKEPDSFSHLYRTALERSRSLPDGPMVWRVYELPSTSYDRRHGNSLVFEHASIIRRLRNYPSEWRRLDDAALLRLCHGGVGVRG